MTQAALPSRGKSAASMLLLGFAILAVGHSLMYLCLTGDARAGLSQLAAEYPNTSLDSALKPGPAPMAGTAEYSPWLRRYERWHAHGEFSLHARHESLVRIGMILSFLVGLGLLGHSMLRSNRAPERRVRDRRTARSDRRAQPRGTGARRPAAPRPASRPRMPVAKPARRPAAVRPAAVRPVAVKPRAVKPQAVKPVRPKPARLRQSA